MCLNFYFLSTSRKYLLHWNYKFEVEFSAEISFLLLILKNMFLESDVFVYVSACGCAYIYLKNRVYRNKPNRNSPVERQQSTRHDCALQMCQRVFTNLRFEETFRRDDIIFEIIFQGVYFNVNKYIFTIIFFYEFLKSIKLYRLTYIMSQYRICSKTCN